MKKIMCLRRFSEHDKKYLTDALSKYYELIFPEKIIEKNLENLVGNIEIFIGNKISENILKKSTKLELIQCPGAGTNFFDFKLLKKYNITLTNSHSNSVYVAEYAMSLLFTLLKKTHHHDRFMRQGNWYEPKGNFSDKFYMSDTIVGKIVGIYGYGNVGKKIAQFCKGFDNEVLFVKKRKDSQSVSFDELLKKSDIIFITAPLTNETRNIFNENTFSLIKKNAYIINVSRGELIEEKPLYDALKNSRIAGAAIDVWRDIYINNDMKYPSSSFKFHELKNLVLSPYRAGYVENMSPHLKDVVSNLIAYAKNEKINNIVNLDIGY